ncbi:hypothetical protein M378DRAFT_158949 [Amanita muscaria Koide BX008]|uniref:Uncharacterized protein n=1 Tax=Amanita muscaria (strain Koide BX008) TaxID=946122 RepID=A0A0C2SWC5_AMAMK|nr:hypothetical protein M378DRAFT_158949 [Amanita muscaria Koide BX008]
MLLNANLIVYISILQYSVIRKRGIIKSAEKPLGGMMVITVAARNSYCAHLSKAHRLAARDPCFGYDDCESTATIFDSGPYEEE